MAKPPFYANGIQFECQGSGKCCTSRGTYGFVYLTDEDQKRFAGFFKLSQKEFIQQYCGTKEGWVFLKDDPSKKGDCIFLAERRCTAYEGRPEQCRTWPFWPENMNSRTWQKEIATYCPGVGKGKVHTFEEIKAVLDSQAKE